MKASVFKAQCLRLMDEVARTGEAIVITKKGKPVSRLEPYRQGGSSLFGVDRERFGEIGDVITPVEADWEALR